MRIDFKPQPYRKNAATMGREAKRVEINFSNGTYAIRIITVDGATFSMRNVKNLSDAIKRLGDLT